MTSTHGPAGQLLTRGISGGESVSTVPDCCSSDATCGFGVTYENLHAPNEHIQLDTIQMTSDVYSTAIHALLTSAAAHPTA